MKYIILICDGAADWPIEELGNKTIFEAAETPSMDWIASHGQMGLLKTIPDGMNPGSAIANMTIMGYDPKTEFTGRGPFEALSAGVQLENKDIYFRLNLITIEEGLIKDYSSGHITTAESKSLIQTIQSELSDKGVDFFPGVQYRHILRLDGNNYSANIHLTAPHDQLDKPYKRFLAEPNDSYDIKAKTTAIVINQLIEKSYEHLINHEININRGKNGKRMATHIWPWSGGKKPNLKSLKEKYGLEGAVISAVDLIFGIGIAAGLEPLHVEGATGLPNTNYKGKVDAAIQVLREKDFVYLHIEATDEMGHTGVPQKKIDALKDFDEKVVKPFIEAEEEFNNEIVIAILPDHPTPCKIRTHSNEPVPFVIFNPKRKPKEVKPRQYSEKSGEDGEFGLVKNGEEFMQLLLSE